MNLARLDQFKFQPVLTNMKVTLKQHGRQIKRSFCAKEQNTNSTWKKFAKLLDRDPKILPSGLSWVVDALRVARKRTEVFFTNIDVPWYFDEVGREIFRSQKPCQLQVKACGEYHFIQLIVDGKELSTKPYFHRFAPKKEKLDATNLRGPADLLLFLSADILRAKKSIHADELLKWFHLELDIRFIRKSASGKEIEIDVEPHIVWPVDQNSANWIKYSDPDKYLIKYSIDVAERKLPMEHYTKKKPPKHQILVASRNVQKALQQIAEVWHNPSVGSVLLSAWTGSGKEVLQDVFMHGLKQSKPITLAAPDLATKVASESIFRAIGTARFDGAQKLTTKTVVFIDEVHHASAAGVRESLLTAMESSKLEDKGQIYDCKGMLTFLFAASNAPQDLRKLSPPDFWTRIEHTVCMSHPLRLDHPQDLKLSIEQYFILFWHQSLQDVEDVDRLRDEAFIEKVSNKFVHLFGSQLIPIISIRNIRSIVKRLANRAVYCMKTDSFPTNHPAAKLGEYVAAKFDEWSK
jgi:hypothetical protein